MSVAILGRDWNLGKDNFVKANPGEMRKLKTKRHLTERTLHLECKNLKMEPWNARAIAIMHLSDAVIGGCGYINVRGPRWHYEFKTKDLNNEVRSRRIGRRMGMPMNPIEKISAGAFYDETRKLWQVPGGYETRETLRFPAP